MIRNKTIKFDLTKPEDRELWEYLRDLEHGEFSVMTKQFWRNRKKIQQLDEFENKNDMVERLMEVSNKYMKESESND